MIQRGANTFISWYSLLPIPSYILRRRERWPIIYISVKYPDFSTSRIRQRTHPSFFPTTTTAATYFLAQRTPEPPRSGASHPPTPHIDDPQVTSKLRNFAAGGQCPANGQLPVLLPLCGGGDVDYYMYRRLASRVKFRVCLHFHLSFDGILTEFFRHFTDLLLPNTLARNSVNISLDRFHAVVPREPPHTGGEMDYYIC
ncbi:hypothetical protein C8R43DRAFT_1119564 [Mycena crocata]|nr:hypothetical protein C8R43DRAFT_1119564 [Mycena crocata]